MTETQKQQKAINALVHTKQQLISSVNMVNNVLAMFIPDEKPKKLSTKEKHYQQFEQNKKYSK
jgi:hypothetical protein